VDLDWRAAEALKRTRSITADRGAPRDRQRLLEATQTDILLREIMAWSAQAEHTSEEALTVMRQAADDENAVEKLPVTPGPILPAREQLGDLLLGCNHSDLALKEFETALANAPPVRGAEPCWARHKPRHHLVAVSGHFECDADFAPIEQTLDDVSFGYFRARCLQLLWDFPPPCPCETIAPRRQ